MFVEVALGLLLGEGARDKGGSAAGRDYGHIVDSRVIPKPG